MPTHIKKHGIFIFCLFVFLLFLARNPFSIRTLIPNLEPYPDTVHYLSPAWNFASGNGFRLFREDRPLKTWVPPLYSAVMIPAFLIRNDVRMFYFVNVFLALISFFLFYKIIQKILDSSHIYQYAIFSPILLFVSLFLYVTNYFFYWYPTLAMGENLTLAVYLIALYLLLSKITARNIILFSLITFLIFLAKTANLPLSGLLFLLYGVKLFIEKNQKVKRNNIKIYGAGLTILAFAFIIFSDELANTSAFATISFYFQNIFPKQNSETGKQIVQASGWFSLGYIPQHLPHYFRALFGGYPVRFLWDNTPIVPLYVGIPAMVGLLAGILHARLRFLAISLLLVLFVSLLSISTFYSLDMRYLFHIIPTVLIGFVKFWVFIYEKLQILNPKSYSNPKLSKSKNKINMTFRVSDLFKFWGLGFSVLLLTLFGYYLATNAVRFKKQIMLNLKYAETPWYYISVLKLNEYFKNYPASKPVPVVISSMIPYYIDFFSNNKYTLLPLSPDQEFRSHKKSVWGDFDYSDLIKLYYKVLLSGHELYVHNYGLGNEKVLHDDFKKIEENFVMKKVSEGCYDLCNIWQLKMKWGVEWVKQSR